MSGCTKVPQLTQFDRLDESLRCEARTILDKFYADVCEDFLYAVVTATKKKKHLTTLLLLDIEYAISTVLWGSLKTAFRALADSKLGKSKLGGDTKVRVFWKEKMEFRSRYDDETESDSGDGDDDDDSSRNSTESFELHRALHQEHEVVNDVPEPGRPWRAGGSRACGAWASVHPSRSQAVLFHVPAFIERDKLAGTASRSTTARIDACMIEYPRETAWQAYDVTIAGDRQQLYLFFETPLAFWSSKNHLSDAEVLLRGWTDSMRFPPRANKAWDFFDDRSTLRRKRQRLPPVPDYFQVQFFDAFVGHHCHTESVASTFACVSTLVVDTRPDFMTKKDCYYTEWSALRDALLGIEFRVAHGARVIQRAWRRCVADPAYIVCRRRLRKEFDCDLTGLRRYSRG